MLSVCENERKNSPKVSQMILMRYSPLQPLCSQSLTRSWPQIPNSIHSQSNKLCSKNLFLHLLYYLPSYHLYPYGLDVLLSHDLYQRSENILSLWMLVSPSSSRYLVRRLVGWARQAHLQVLSAIHVVDLPHFQWWRVCWRQPSAPPSDRKSVV